MIYSDRFKRILLFRCLDEFRKDFEDCARADNGKAYGYGQRTKGHQHRTPDSLAMDQRLQFKDFDRETGKDYDT